MKAKLLPESWEKQKIAMLENGWKVTEEYNIHYGSFVKRLDSPDGKVWVACNGLNGAEKCNKIFGCDKYIDLPDFALPYVNKHGLVNPFYTFE